MLPSSHIMRPRRWEAWFSGPAAFLAVFLLATGVRAAFGGRHGLWADEVFSLAMATGHSLEHPAAATDASRGDFAESPVAEPVSAYARYLEHDEPPAGPGRVMRAALLSDTSPPLYYLLLSAWTRALGTGDAALRGFSVLASLACLPLLWQLARVFGGRAAAIPTTLLFAVVPPCVYYSTEGRMYSLQWLLTLGLVWATWRMASGGAGPRTAALWVAVGAAGLLTHYFQVFVWGAAVLWLLLHPGTWNRKSILVCAGLTSLLVVPWYLHVPQSLHGWRVTAGWLNIRPGGHSPFAAILWLPWSFLTVRTFGGWPTRWDWLNLAAYLALAVIALGRAGLPRFVPSRRLVALWLLAACLGPVVWDLALGTFTVAVPRYAIAGMPAAFLVVGLAAARLRPTMRVLLIGPILLFCAVGLVRFGRLEARSGPAFREIGARLAREARPDDLVLVHSIPSGVCGIARYTQAALGGRPGPAFAAWVGQLGRRRVPDDMEALLAGRSRVFFVNVHAVGAPDPEREWLEAHAALLGTRDFLVFAPRDGPTF